MRRRLFTIASLVVLALNGTHCLNDRIYANQRPLNKRLVGTGFIQASTLSEPAIVHTITCFVIEEGGSLSIALTTTTVVSFTHIKRGRGGVTSRGVNDVIEAVLATPGLDGCFLTIVTLNLSPAITTEQIIQKFGGKKGVGLFDIQKEGQSGNLTLSSSTLINDIQMVKESSGCQTFILISDDPTSLKTFLRQIHDSSSLLSWPTRLVVVTHAQLQSLLAVRREISVTNSVIAILEGGVGNRRASLHICLPFSLRVIRIASWTPRDGLRFSSGFQLFPDKFKSLADGGQMKVASENYPPHAQVEEIAGDSDGRISYSGPVLTLLDTLAMKINFTYNLVRPPDGSWGMRRPDGSWTGMVGMVYRKEVDMALGPFGITYLRSQFIDYTKSMFVDYVRVLAKRGETEVDPWGFVMPLAPTVWFTTFGVLALVLVTVSLMVLVSPDPEKELGNMAVQYVRIFIQQDMVMKSKMLWTRILMGSWVLLLFVVVKCYSGNLMSLLAVRYLPQPYQTLRRVVDDPAVTMLWEANSAFMQVIKATVNFTCRRNCFCL
ncbi:uncharacterized protein LOC135210426 [Macrobrachium nipponense]|uniref:uncharacterized protein LOC135210426 n=1 Tax=Macrobrachium nipponense TaxID=159736 RepID=UPI0030C7C394